METKRMNPSPEPWIAEKDGPDIAIISCPGEEGEHVVAKLPSDPQVNNELNAYVICKSVNCFDVMLDALKSLDIHVAGQCEHKTADGCSKKMREIVNNAIIQVEDGEGGG